ncbi:MAG TPA: SemiSWEET transporter [Rhodoferax sp.]|jgi:MtN3 and saliva related transmembrane protein|nr:SemiSWEET transporter [Rhodoferax sp.]HQC86909.1 SemiSWEET transporter [Rhodoferax sp.]HQY77964.1 SemiSWEET transporter [Rhodoferax sp.]
MNAIDIIGTLAAILTTASFVPQALHTFQTKDVRGISLGMYSAFTAGVSLWLVYGILLSAWPIIIANAITVSLALAILVMKLRYHEGD